MSDEVKGMSTMVKYLLSLAAVVSMVFSVFFFVENRYASKEDYVKLEKRLSLNELQQLLKDALENMYFYRKLARENPEDREISRKLIVAEEEVSRLKKRIEELQK